MTRHQGAPLEIPAAWRGSELFERSEWLVRLTSEDRDELARAAAATAATDLEELSPAQFELPRLGPRLARVQDTLEHGCGATLLRGLELGSLPDTSVERVFYAIALHIGTPLSQSAKGERLLRVQDERFGTHDPRVRGPHTSRRLSFHTDRCDVIAFLCVRDAMSGGENHIVSSVTLYNEMLRDQPAALRVLEEPFVYLRHTVDGGNERRFTRQPVFTIHEGHFAASYLRVLIDRADREPGLPDLTTEQRDALDTLDRVADDPSLYASLRLEKGDVLLLNNWVTFHRRTAFEDHEAAKRRRLLLRIWLSVPNSRPLDPRFAEHFGATAAGALRGGMRPETD